MKEEEIREFKEVNPTISNLLPSKPNKIILAFNPVAGGDRQSPASRLPSRFRPRAYYEFDLRSGSKKLLMQGKIALAQVQFDKDANPVYAFGFDASTDEFVYYYRAPGTKDWREMHRRHEDSFESFNVHGLDPEKPDTLLVSAHNGRDKTALWEFDLKTMQF
ncbi:MAG: hypothetical protein GWN87_21690, partial [Desulfuromonadales bacterium]|nr:hypothetical protein [Desulfuromonadales bacterium]